LKRENGNLIFDRRPTIRSFAAVAGKKEGEGPLAKRFDCIIHDSYAGKDTFEQAESELMNAAVRLAMEKGGLRADDIDIAFCGDLLNQCVASSFAMAPVGIPYAGIYGACSTMGLGLILSAMAIESGAASRAVCAASSHYCTAERQYRLPLEYGSQRPPTAQWTVTGSGACILERTDTPDMRQITSADFDASGGNRLDSARDSPYIASARIGKITDYAVTDQNNMGAAMAPAVVKLGTIII